MAGTGKMVDRYLMSSTLRWIRDGVDFCKFICIPLATLKRVMPLCRQSTSLLDPLQKSRMSSTKRRCVSCNVGANSSLVRSPLWTASIRNRLRPSATKRKISGESGHPYCNPLSALKKGEVSPFMRTAKDAVEMHPITHRTNVASNPR